MLAAGVVLFYFGFCVIVMHFLFSCEGPDRLISLHFKLMLSMSIVTGSCAIVVAEMTDGLYNPFFRPRVKVKVRLGCCMVVVMMFVDT
jgi:hypothetical protein